MKRLWNIVWLIVLAGCGDAGTGVSNPPTGTSTNGLAAGAVAGLFGSKSNASLNAKLVLQNGSTGKELGGSCGETDPACTCEEALSGRVSQDHPIENKAYVAPGTYGSAAASDKLLTLVEGDACTLANGTVSTSTGPGSFGRVAGFLLKGDVTATCTSSDGTSTSLTMKQNSTGAWRNTIAAHTGVAYQPQIWGTFQFDVGGQSSTLNCTIYLGAGETTEFANCSDQNGASVTQTTGLTCTFN